jgi:hypothetical protein
VVREAGLQVMLLAMAEEIEALTGCGYQRFADRQAQRWSREHGFVVVDGQKVPIERRRLRGKDGSEVRWVLTSCSSRRRIWTTISGGKCYAG